MQSKYKLQGKSKSRNRGRKIISAKQAKESLRLFRALIDRSNDTIEVLDPETGRFLDVNERGCVNHGYSREEYLSLRIFDIDPGVDPGAFTAYMAKLRESGAITWNGAHRRKDGTTFPVEVNLQYVRLDRDYLVAVVRDVTERRAQEQKILVYQRQLKSLASQLTLAEEHLRRDVATEIHDEISQVLAIAKVRIEALTDAGSDDRLPMALGGIADLLERALQRTRALTAKLSHPTLDVLGFQKAVEKWLHDEVQIKHGIETAFSNGLEDKSLDDDVRVILFRSVRELLANVIKHARATRVTVSITCTQDGFSVVVEDNGVGFDPEETLPRSGGFGLLSIRESLERLEGSLDIESHRQAGSRITLRGPLQVRNSSETGRHEDPDCG